MGESDAVEQPDCQILVSAGDDDPVAAFFPCGDRMLEKVHMRRMGDIHEQVDEVFLSLDCPP
jgi:hypothetical protein